MRHGIRRTLDYGIFLFGLLFCVSYAACADALFTPDTDVSQRLRLDYSGGYLGDAFTYETGFGRITVKSKGDAYGFRARLLKNTEIGYQFFDYDIDSYFAGALVGVADTAANLFHVKQKLRFRGADMALEYKFLDNSTISGVHFISVFRGKKSGRTEFTGGLASYFGKNVDDRIGAFAAVAWRPDDTVTLFAEYNTADFMKAFQNYVIAPTAQNIGVIDTGNAPRDALSIGVKGRFPCGIEASFSLYDLDVQRRPMIGISYTR